jgi:hypothetical protein
MNEHGRHAMETMQKHDPESYAQIADQPDAKSGASLAGAQERCAHHPAVPGPPLNGPTICVVIQPP